MNEFNIEKFKEFIKTKIVWFPKKHKKGFTIDQFISALCNFSEIPYKTLNISISSNFTEKCNKIFDYKKPAFVQVQNWLLYEFGFQKCYYTQEILPINEFIKCNKYWNGLSRVCKKAHTYQTNKYRKENLEKYSYYASKRNAKKVNAIPLWFTNTDAEIIENMFLKTKKLFMKTGVEYQIDHIIPLQGKYVSGLHIPNNLQIITAKENQSKNNYHESEEYWKS